MPDYTGRLLAAFAAEHQRNAAEVPHPPLATSQPLIDSLSDRELEILQLIARGLSNREISEQLFLALDTVKGHNRNIFAKLQVKRRTEAVARARELGLF
jgi:LuxR family maltose regulon positive regulatory protein